jgi:hypothetical protein
MSKEAMELLILAAKATGPKQGMIIVTRFRQGHSIHVGNHHLQFQLNEHSRFMVYEQAIRELVDAGFLRQAISHYEVTPAGYNALP